MENQTKALVVLSGGMDSVTLLYHAKNMYDVVEAVTFDYGSKHNSKEIVFAKEHCDKLGIKQQVITMDWNKWGFKSDLLKSGGDIPEGHYESPNMKSTVVPFRNGIMLSIAVGLAESKDIPNVLIGSHAGDHAVYPDCRAEFTEAINKAANLGTYIGVDIVAPFKNIMKWDIAKIGLDLGIDYDKTWSCYKGGDEHCHKCGTCVERDEAIEKAKEMLE